jgi:hypothetical protein
VVVVVVVVVLEVVAVAVAVVLVVVVVEVDVVRWGAFYRRWACGGISNVRAAVVLNQACLLQHSPNLNPSHRRWARR